MGRQLTKAEQLAELARTAALLHVRERAGLFGGGATFFGFHQQGPSDLWDMAVGSGRLRSLVLVGDYEMAPTARAASPTPLMIVGRHWVAHQDPYLVEAAKGPAYADAAADHWLDHSWDSVVRNGLNAIKSLNEVYETGKIDKNRAAMAFDHALIRRTVARNRERGTSIRPCVFSVPVGNIETSELGLFRSLFLEAAEHGAIMMPNCYWSAHYGTSFVASPTHADNLHLRWRVWDDFVRARDPDAAVDWLIGESGPCAANQDGYYLDSVAGWRHLKCLGGDIDKLVEDWSIMDYLDSQTAAGQSGRLLGRVHFTSYQSGWEWFRLVGSDALRLAEYTLTPGGVAPSPIPSRVRVKSGIGHLNLRSRPVVAPDSDIGDLHPGAAPLEVSAVDGEWYKLGNGWFHRDYVDPID